MVTYYGSLSDPSVNEYFTIEHEGYAGEKARRNLFAISQSARINHAAWAKMGLEDIASALNDGKPPATIEYRMDGKFYRVIKRTWDDQATEAA